MENKLKISITNSDGIIVDTIEIIEGNRPDENDVFDDNIYENDQKQSKIEAIIDRLNEII